jgi:hypothetical protein
MQAGFRSAFLPARCLAIVAGCSAPSAPVVRRLSVAARPSPAAARDHRPSRRCRCARPGAIADGETQWTFAPTEPWQTGDYNLSVLPELEDVSGNRIGHAFETLSSGGDDTHQPPAHVPFRVGQRR